MPLCQGGSENQTWTPKESRKADSAAEMVGFPPPPPPYLSNYPQGKGPWKFGRKKSETMQETKYVNGVLGFCWGGVSFQRHVHCGRCLLGLEN